LLKFIVEKEVILTDPYSLYSREVGKVFEAFVSTKIEANLEYLLLKDSRTGVDRTAADWHTVRGANLEQVIQQYGFLGMGFYADC
jgi:hypothetical protein